MTSVEDMDYNQSITDFELIDRFWQSFLITLYSLTAAVSFIGNIIAIWVLMAGKRSSRELRMFLVNLSLSDVIMALFSIPFTYTDFIMGRWIFMPQFCPIVQFMQLTSVFVSVYTLTIIGIDRYIAIMYPFGTSRWSKSLGPYIVSAIWLLGIGLGSVTWFNSVAEPFVVNNETYYDCRETWTEQGKRTYTLNIFMITFALPLLVLSYVYGAVGYKMIRHSMPGNADAARDEAQHLAKVKVIKMLSTIVILFALCWLPIHVLNLVISFKSEWLESLNSMDSGPQLYVALVISAHWLSMSNSFVNPVIYCFMSDNFRTDLKCLAISRCKGRRIKKSANGRSDDGKGRSLHKIRFRSSMAAVNDQLEDNHHNCHNNNNSSSHLEGQVANCQPMAMATTTLT
ncbi:RYamide receptor-like [Oppia nitens]|uniref:RYamide receptor-like n=1 Tax=Oppia nitens TaxID=1686743 RepID=UPI0023DB6E35|nr:RYamide receptor-like [Oppia nitens]